MMKNISIRLREDFMKEAQKIALEKFSKGKVSTSEAAEIADLSVGEMMDEIAKRGLKQQIRREDINGSLERGLKVIK